MPTLETNTPTFWYAFQRQSELRTVLYQCAPEVLLASYKLWRFETLGEGKKLLLLSVQEHPLPDNWCVLLTPDSIREEQHVMVGDSPNTDGRVRLSLREHQTNKPFGEGWAFPLRQGEHLLASLGFERVPPKTEIAWALFSMPNHRLHEAISDHFTLNNHDVRCSSIQPNQKQWLWVRQPELYLVLKYKDFEDVEVFQSFPEERSLFTPWGYRSALGGRLHLPQTDSLLLFYFNGSNEQLDTTSWWMASEVITIEQLPTIEALRPHQGPPQIPVKLRYERGEPPDVPSLWLLEGPRSLRLLESLFLDLHPDARAALSLFAGQSEAGPCYLLRDDRPQRNAPLFAEEGATGCLPLLQEEGLYVKAGTRVIPSLPALVWRKELRLSGTNDTLLLPSEDGTSLRVLQAPRQQFAPLEQFVHYQLGAQPEALVQLAAQTTFEVLFTPAAIEATSAPPPPRVVEPPPLQQEPLSEPKRAVAEETLAVPEKSFRRDVKTPRLLQLEKQLQAKLRKNSPVPPRDWVTLASLYQQEHNAEHDLYWLHEAIKTLDQVLYLDRRATNAVKLEQEVLETLLQIEGGLSSSQKIGHLDQLASQGDPLLMRLIFRYRTRMLLDDPETDEEMALLRQAFYRDLAQVEEHLTIREYIIYVAGGAQYLGDTELHERARLRYRQLLADVNRLQRELPDLVMNT